jgi:hypothetical protein
MNVAIITGLVGALVGAGVSIFTTWLTQRSQLQRELAQRRFGELTRWTNEKRVMFRDIHVAINDWTHLLRMVARDGGRPVSDEELREVEGRLHGLVYDATLLCSPQVYDLVDEAEEELLRLTVSLGRATQYDPAGPTEQAKLMAKQVAVEDFPKLREIRLRLMAAMQAELTPPLVDEVDRLAPTSPQ